MWSCVRPDTRLSGVLHVSLHAEALLLARFGELTLATLNADVSARLLARGQARHKAKRHG